MPNYEVLDARIASALNKIIHNPVVSLFCCVKSTSPTTENGYENCIYSMNNINMER